MGRFPTGANTGNAFEFFFPDAAKLVEVPPAYLTDATPKERAYSPNTDSSKPVVLGCELICGENNSGVVNQNNYS